MVSPELLRRYQFFSGLTSAQLVTLAMAGSEIEIVAGYRFFHEGDALKAFYLVLEGAICIDIAVPRRDVKHEVSKQLNGDLQMDDVTVSTAGTGDVFGWSAIIPPTVASAGAKAITSGRVIAFDCERLVKVFSEDCALGYLMVMKAAQVFRERLRDLRIESLVLLTR